MIRRSFGALLFGAGLLALSWGLEGETYRDHVIRALPSDGANGTTWLLVGGGVLVLFSLLLIFRRDRRWLR